MERDERIEASQHLGTRLSGSGMRLLQLPTWHQMVDSERDASVSGGAEMVEPVAKRLCSTVASVARRVAVEGNIGERESGKREGRRICMRKSHL